MSESIQAIRGMNDLLPSSMPIWNKVEHVLREIMASYCYQEIRFPIIEKTALFKRSIGEVTDIVEKEMYTFSDLNGDNLSLRPEGTAGCLRACIEHGLLYNQQQKLWYLGPMFRHERPQKGRYRQFHQFGVEAFGYPNFAIELELLALSAAIWKKLGISQHLTLEINSIGHLEERLAYREKLISYFKAHQSLLDEDSLRRLERNPLRILDSKNPQLKSLIANAPQLLDHLSPESREHFEQLCQGLQGLEIPYKINPCLVRGIDYYSHTVFEWVTDKLGAQSTVLAGGRYDALVLQLGGPETSAVGFALGLERLILLMESLEGLPEEESHCDLFFIADSEQAQISAIRLADELREKTPFRVFVNPIISSFKSQFKKADKSGAKLSLIIGVDELQAQTVSIKNLRQQAEQVNIAQDKLVSYLLESL